MPLRGLLQRALVACLALAGDSGVSRKQLMAGLWSTPPASGTGALRAQISRLRDAFGEHRDVIETTSDGYRLAPAVTIDLVELQQSTDLATDLVLTDPLAALAAFDEVPTFTNVRAFETLEDFPFVRDAGASAGDVLRQAALLRSRLLATSRPSESDALLAPLAIEHPLDEAIAALRMDVLVDLGRGSDALAVAQLLRSHLRELGLLPNDEIQRRELEILQADTSETEGPSAGGSTQLARISAALDNVMLGRGGTVTVHGAPGSGKTHLVGKMVELADAGGLSSVVLRATEFGEREPFHLLLEASAKVLRGAADLDLASCLAVPVARTDPAANRYQVAQAVVERLRDLDQPCLVVAEDLHWSDPASLVVLHALIDAADTLPLLVLCTGRSGESWLDQLGSLPRPTIEVAPLTSDEANGLAIEAVGGALSDRLTLIVEQCLGNPLLIREYLRGLEIEGRLVRIGGTVDCRGEAAPETVRSLITRRLKSLDPASADLVAQAAVLGTRCDLALLAHTAGVTAAEVQTQLMSASGIGLVQTTKTSVAFTHDLVRGAVCDDMSAAEQSERHRKAAAALAKQGTGSTAAAAHTMLANVDVEPEELAWLHQAANQVAALDPVASLSFLDRALAAPSDLNTRFLLQRAKLEALITAGQLQEATSLVDMLVRAERPEVAQLRLRLAGLMLVQNQPAAALEVLVAASASTDPHTAAAAQVKALASMGHLLSLDAPTALVEAREALSIGRACEDPVSQSLAHGVLGRASTMSHHYGDGFAHCRLAAEFSEADSSGESAMYAPWFSVGLSALDLDDGEALALAVERGRAASCRYGVTWSDPLVLRARSGVCVPHRKPARSSRGSTVCVGDGRTDGAAGDAGMGCRPSGTDRHPPEVTGS